MLAAVEAFSASVRPVPTYWLCVLMYGAYKTASYFIMIDVGADWMNAVTTLWTPVDYQIMLSIIGFWFVDRAIRKIKV
jgi:hypothetical protein